MEIFSRLARLFVWTVMINFLILLAGTAAYPEPFSLLMDPLSWLGKWVTAQGFANTGVFLLAAVTLIADAAVWCYAFSLLAATSLGRRPVIRVLGRMIPAGLVIMAFPCDTFILTHSAGSALLIGGLWAFTMVSLYHFRSHGILSPAVHLSLQCLLHVTAVFCGINFAWDTPLKGFSQRPLLFAILVDTAFSLRTLVRESQRSFAFPSRN